MKTIRFLLAITCALIPFVTLAATLQVKVNEVQSGNTLVVSNTSRTLKVRLKGIAPPEPEQLFSDVAREHLKTLVLNKAVALDYSNLSGQYLEAKISLNGTDVGAQMLRDGVAWYERDHAHGLSAADRELYENCEQAARAEKRGLWSDTNPVAPWEFRKEKQQDELQNETETAKQSKDVNLKGYRAAAAKKEMATRVLSNKYFGRGDVQPGDIAGNPTIKQVDPKASPESWISYRSNDPKFSIRVPGHSYIFQYPVLGDELKIVNMNYLIGLHDGAFYSLTWAKGSSLVHAPDKTMADAMVDEWVKGINHYFDSERLPYKATYRSGQILRVGSYTGKQYSISADIMAGYVRILSRRVGDQYEYYALAVLSRTGDESAFDFLNSLKLAASQK